MMRQKFGTAIYFSFACCCLSMVWAYAQDFSNVKLNGEEQSLVVSLQEANMEEVNCDDDQPQDLHADSAQGLPFKYVAE